jgi:predicted TIM-barrel fold metal-dependent hydrolase
MVTATRAAPVDDSLAAIPIIDIDTHFTEPPDLWTSRAPAKLKDKVLHVKKVQNGSEAWFLGDQFVSMVGPSVVRKDLSKELHTFSIKTYDEMTPAATDPRARVGLMDKRGVAMEVVYPNIIGFGAQALLKFTKDTELLRFHIETYNNAIADLQTASNGRLLPQAALPLWDIDASIVELKRIREKLGLTGIAMSDKPADFGQVKLAERPWDNFWAACQDSNTPVNFHIGSGSFEGDIYTKWWEEKARVVYDDFSLNGPLALFSSVHAFMNNFVDISMLILTGILEKYRKLKFVSVESGASWIPFVLQSLETNWDELMADRDRAKFSRRPTEAFRDQVYASYWFENANAVKFFIDEIGADNLLFETDFPHPNSLYPKLHGKLQETLANFDIQTQRKVLYQNAERIYGIDVSAHSVHAKPAS